ncbi:hypothetical protein DFH07DRAFT_850412 [Mycena maculata]|uniref:F-box domain-containing protein n=1 Tax=Mycena maculata TaxID=230809 RepID=A0AAD7HXF2_9AGAR|nr:hypothetical protein DFH07DRAFT_850412 [Mycena maculata]
MDSCPNEILQDIVNFLPEADLFRLRLVERRLRDVSTRLAFSRLVVYDNISSVQRFHNLVECQDDMILHSVGHITFDGTSPDHFDVGAEPTPELLEKSFSLLSRFPKLESLRLDFFPDSAPDKNEMYLTYYVEVQIAFWIGLACTPLPQLRSLHIGSMVSYFPRCIDNDEDPFLRLFHPLTSLSISVVSLFQPRRLPDEILSFPQNVSNMVLAAQKLTSLDLGEHELAGTSHFAFERLTFSALLSLRLHTFVFAGEKDDEVLPPPQVEGAQQPFGVEKFILRHKATLQHLQLRDCAVASQIGGSWHCLLRRFRLQLSQLIEFIWIANSAHPDQEQNFVYARPAGHLHTYTVIDEAFEFIADDPQDVAALEELQSVVLLRKNNITG